MAGAVTSRSWPGLSCSPILMATSARRSGLTGSIDAEIFRSWTVMGFACCWWQIRIGVHLASLLAPRKHRKAPRIDTDEPTKYASRLSKHFEENSHGLALAALCGPVRNRLGDRPQIH